MSETSSMMSETSMVVHRPLDMAMVRNTHSKCTENKSHQDLKVHVATSSFS